MLRFNMLLNEAGINPAQVRLLRHAPKVGERSLLDVWRIDRDEFEDYQALQWVNAKASFARPYWASFIGTWDGRTVFAGLYEIGAHAIVEAAGIVPISNVPYEGGALACYETCLSPLLNEYSGRLYIDWGGGKLAWNQRAEGQDKVITELRASMVEAPFPGLLTLNLQLSELADAPSEWIIHLAAAKGIYMLCCPRDGSRYIGSATAEGGFWARWSEYRANGHGGNIGLIDRDPSDFTATILQVAGSADTLDDILAAEARWKDKMQTRIWGLNRN